MPNCTPSLIASQSRHPRRRTATPVVSLNRARPNMGHTWTPNCPIYFLPVPYSLLAQPLADKGSRCCPSGRRQAPSTILGWPASPSLPEPKTLALGATIILLGALNTPWRRSPYGCGSHRRSRWYQEKKQTLGFPACRP